jgi:Tol biopolymer transport system component
MKAFNTKTEETLGFCVYPYWHPSGRYIAYSTNNTRQGFHVGGRKIIEVMDLASDMQVYDIDRNKLLVCEALKGDSAFETFPAFSADGKTLFFSVARPKNYPTEMKEMYYSLCSIAFDAETGTYGTQIDTLVNGDALCKSAVYARPSYDGRFLCYTVADYGYFHIWHPESDLYLLDLKTGESRPMTEANSPDAESVHSWSSNSRWLVFGSRRDDGLYTRPYFCHIAEDGKVGKAFMLPQRNPRQFYEGRFMSYNIPEFVTAPVPLDNKLAERQIVSDERVPMGVERNR